ncbi:hypothetical protein BZG02_13945 [Labilibaculum filiforme]|uniref:histidine kinase n=1 Tax=Labilibaculum filiforme TaxID=1940526 RepID=A0A2N3HVD4_9BACT|nr:PAS domain-containing hybrid sensor histidine kinase/response regulator [Labilibaculum filiforme]PKQ62036.1 hypothetical protein BZG02_13945 [Labilibaculum filiforme]
MKLDTSLQIRQLEKIHRIAGIGYWVYAYNSNKMWWSNITYSILGYDKQDINPSRQNFLKHLHPEDLEFFLTSLEQMKKQLIEFEFRFFKNGELRLGKITGEVYSDDLDGLIEEVLFQDITEIKIKEYEIEKAWHKALEAENLKNSFLANMSHELRTPLNSIIGFSELLETSSPNDSVRKFASTIKGSGIQLLHIIEDLLKVSMLESRVSKPIKRNFHLNQMLLDIKNISQLQLKTNNKEHIQINFNFELSPTNDIIKSDQIKIRTIFKNLINNAIKFTETGSITCAYKIIKDTIHFWVTDTGVGIPSEYENRVFKRFQQADESGLKYYGGMGLGMYISRLEVELLGGKIWFVSEKNIGTTVNFSIPNILTSNYQHEETPITNSYNWENYTVIIAEDQITNFKILEAYLLKTNINILWAKNGQEVIDTCIQNPEINIVLMDINLPIVNGLEATRAIKEKRPNLTIIAQTAFALVGDKEKSLQAGCSDHLPKPISKSDLLESMAKFLP